MTKITREQIRFDTEAAAQKTPAEAGFCLGQQARDEPRGIMVGVDWIAKWRNLSSTEKAELHGCYHRTRKDGPVTITVQAHCPTGPLAALRKAAAEQ